MFERHDWIVGIFSILLGAFTIYGTTTWQETMSLDPAGPGAVPVILAWGIIIIGVIHLVGAWSFKGTAEKRDWLAFFAKEKTLVQITLLSIAYILLIETIGYLIVTPLLIIGIMWVVRVRNIKSMIVTGISTTLIMFLVFYVALKVKLPMGFLEFIF